jgi:hypothetical protein
VRRRLELERQVAERRRALAEARWEAEEQARIDALLRARDAADQARREVGRAAERQEASRYFQTRDAAPYIDTRLSSLRREAPADETGYPGPSRREGGDPRGGWRDGELIELRGFLERVRPVGEEGVLAFRFRSEEGPVFDFQPSAPLDASRVREGRPVRVLARVRQDRRGRRTLDLVALTGEAAAAALEQGR